MQRHEWVRRVDHWLRNDLPLPVPHWSSLKRFGTSRVLRSSVLWIAAVPIAARALASINEIQFTLMDKVYSVNLELPFSWQMFFYGSLCFAVASFVFSARCPALIQQFSDSRAFREAGHGGRSLVLFAVAMLRHDLAWTQNWRRQAPLEWMESFVDNFHRKGSMINPLEGVSERTWSHTSLNIQDKIEIPDGKIDEAFLGGEGDSELFSVLRPPNLQLSY